LLARIGGQDNKVRKGFFSLYAARQDHPEKYIWIQNWLQKILIIIKGELKIDSFLHKLDSEWAYLVD
jgi:hypothetical protein